MMSSRMIIGALSLVGILGLFINWYVPTLYSGVEESDCSDSCKLYYPNGVLKVSFYSKSRSNNSVPAEYRSFYPNGRLSCLVKQTKIEGDTLIALWSEGGIIQRVHLYESSMRITESTMLDYAYCSNIDRTRSALRGGHVKLFDTLGNVYLDRSYRYGIVKIYDDNSIDHERLTQRKYYMDDALLLAESISEDYTSSNYGVNYSWNDSLFIPEKIIDSLADIIGACAQNLSQIGQSCVSLNQISPAVVNFTDDQIQYRYQITVADIDSAKWYDGIRMGRWKTGSSKADTMLDHLYLVPDPTTIIVLKNQFNDRKRNGVVEITSTKPLNIDLVERQLYKKGTCARIGHSLKNAQATFDYKPNGGTFPTNYSLLFINVCSPDPITKQEQSGYSFVLYSDHTCDVPVPMKLGNFRGWIIATAENRKIQKQKHKMSNCCGLPPHIPDK